MPGQPVRTRARFRFPPAIHPRELPVCRQLRRYHRSASLRRSYVFGEPTVRQIVAARNRKTFPACEETVEDESCLWNAEENQDGTASDPPVNAAPDPKLRRCERIKREDAEAVALADRRRHQNGET
jgi:hypothetical protein